MDGNGMKRLIFTLAILPAAVLVGCNDSNNESSNNDLGAPSFIISSSNRAQVDQVAGSTATESSTQTYIGGDDGRSLSSNSLFMSNLAREISSRSGSQTEEIDCTTGSGTASGTVTGIDENGEAEPDGSMSVTMTYETCTQEESEDDYSAYHGTVNLDIDWTGFNVSTETFDSLSMTASFDNYHEKVVVGGEVESESTVDGSLTLSATQLEYRASFSLVMSSPEIDNKVIAMETTSDIVRGVSDTYPTSGEIVVTGGEDTQAVYTIVSNGVEVSLNGAQAELITWSEIESGEGEF